MTDGRTFKILHLIDNLGMGGAQVFLYNLVSRWPNERDSLHVAALGSRKELLESFRALDRVTTHVHAGARPQAANIAAAARLLLAGSFDIVHCHLSRSALLALSCPLSRRTGLILHEHGEPELRPAHYHAFMHARARRVDRVFANAPGIAEIFARCVRFPRERIEVVPNGIVLDRFERCGAHRDAFRNELGIAPETPVVGFVGRLTEQKGGDYLIEAFPAIRAAHPDALLLIVGDGPLRAALEARVAALRLAEAVRFAGFQTDTPKWLSVFDVGVAPSLWEPFGIVAIEMMAAGVPLVASDLGGFHENIVEGNTGFLIPPQDAGAIAARVIELLGNRGRADSVVAPARAYAHANYGIERIAERVRGLYGEICGARETAPRAVSHPR